MSSSCVVLVYASVCVLACRVELKVGSRYNTATNSFQSSSFVAKNKM